MRTYCCWHWVICATYGVTEQPWGTASCSFLPAELAGLLFCYSLKNLFSQFIDSVHFLPFSASQFGYLLHPSPQDKLFIDFLILVKPATKDYPKFNLSFGQRGGVDFEGIQVLSRPLTPNNSRELNLFWGVFQFSRVILNIGWRTESPEHSSLLIASLLLLYVDNPQISLWHSSQSPDAYLTIYRAFSPQCSAGLKFKV